MTKRLRKKMGASLLLAGLFFLSQTGMLWAASKTFTVSATVPLATSVVFTTTEYIGATTSSVPGTVLSYDPLVFDTTNNFWYSNQYYSIAVTTAGGAGQTDVTTTYTEGANPNLTGGSGHGFGYKSTISFLTVTGTTETSVPGHAPKLRLIDITGGEHVTPAQLGTGYLKMYVAVFRPDPNAVIPDLSTSEVFSNADRPGVYDGSLLISVTVL